MTKALLLGNECTGKSLYSFNTEDQDDATKPLHEQLRGVPQRPFYREISRRLSIICKYESNELPFLPASHFRVTELQCMNSLAPDPLQITSFEDCTKWLQEANDNNILATLGLRRTVGTVTKGSEGTAVDADCTETECPLFPPSISQLLESSQQLHRPNSKSSLTVAARALAKHAHRGAAGFFGIVQGSESQKNEHANAVVERLMKEAVWINIHAFGGIDEQRPVMEVRTMEGYGARWCAVWDEEPDDVRFRGFLEPNV